MSVIFGIISFMTGITMTLQSAVNGRLRNLAAGNPIFASLASNGCGLLLLCAMLGIAHGLGICAMPGMELIRETKPWMWIGGLVGAALVIGSVIIPKKIGFASYFSMLVAGQLVGSVLADATGFLGNEVHTPGLLRIAGVICLIAGAVLIQGNSRRAADRDSK